MCRTQMYPFGRQCKGYNDLCASDPTRGAIGKARLPTEAMISLINEHHSVLEISLAAHLRFKSLIEVFEWPALI